jgi:hypothetical protein
MTSNGLFIFRDVRDCFNLKDQSSVPDPNLQSNFAPLSPPLSLSLYLSFLSTRSETLQPDPWGDRVGKMPPGGGGGGGRVAHFSGSNERKMLVLCIVAFAI